MRPKRVALFACLLAAGLAGAAQAPAAPAFSASVVSISGSRHSGARPSNVDRFRPSHPGSHRPFPGNRWGYGNRGYSHWGWGLGLAIGVPWALGWYDPWWGPAYSLPYAHGPYYRSYSPGYPCAQDEDCWRERLSRNEPVPPTTEAAPAAPGEDGGPTQRPFHLNYCDSAKAWFPHVRTCPEGWRLVLPEYDRSR